MHPLIFPYKIQKFRLMPIIPIILYGRNVAIEAEAYVDSGAFYSIFDLELAKDIGLKTKDGRRQKFIVGDGSFIPGFIFKIPVQIGEHKFLSEMAFSDKLNIGFNLLGRKGIFENFEEIIFRERKREIEFNL